MVVSIAMIIVQCDNNKDVIYKSATAGDELRMPSCDGDFLTYNALLQIDK